MENHKRGNEVEVTSLLASGNNDRLFQALVIRKDAPKIKANQDLPPSNASTANRQHTFMARHRRSQLHSSRLSCTQIVIEYLASNFINAGDKTSQHDDMTAKRQNMLRSPRNLSKTDIKQCSSPLTTWFHELCSRWIKRTHRGGRRSGDDNGDNHWSRRLGESTDGWTIKCNNNVWHCTIQKVSSIFAYYIVYGHVDDVEQPLKMGAQAPTREGEAWVHIHRLPVSCIFLSPSCGTTITHELNILRSIW